MSTRLNSARVTPVVQEREDSVCVRIGSFVQRGVETRTVNRAKSVWSQLNSLCSLPSPRVMGGDNGQILMAWDNSEHHFEAEIYPEGDIEYFYSNRLTEQFWGEEVSLEGALSLRIQEALKLL